MLSRRYQCRVVDEGSCSESDGHRCIVCSLSGSGVLRQLLSHARKRSGYAVVYSLGIWPSDNLCDLGRGHFVNDEQLHRKPLVGLESRHCGTDPNRGFLKQQACIRVRCFGREVRRLAGEKTSNHSSAFLENAISRRKLPKKIAVCNRGRGTLGNHFICFGVRTSLTNHALENLALHWRQSFWRGKSSTTFS